MQRTCHDCRFNPMMLASPIKLLTEDADIHHTPVVEIRGSEDDFPIVNDEQFTVDVLIWTRPLLFRKKKVASQQNDRLTEFLRYKSQFLALLISQPRLVNNGTAALECVVRDGI
jgi:hypothetical protein